MDLKVIQIGDPILEQKASRVEDFKDKALQELIDSMISICKKNVKITAGLSAPQVGKSLAISICRRTDLEEKSQDISPKTCDIDLWEVMINPKITWQSEDHSIVWEGCLSVGQKDKTLFGPVARPNRVRITYQNRVGDSKELEASEFFAHIVQHEIDHLNGILFLKYVRNPERNLWTSATLDDYIDKHSHYPDIQ